MGAFFVPGGGGATTLVTGARSIQLVICARFSGLDLVLHFLVLEQMEDVLKTRMVIVRPIFFFIICMP